MPHFKISQKDVFFILKEQLNYGSLCTLERYQGLNEKALDLLVTEALRFAKGVVDPLQEIGEQFGVKFEAGQVTCPPEFQQAFTQYGRDGWTAAAAAFRAAGRPMGTEPDFRFVTASLHVDYLRPTPIDAPMELRARVEEIKGRKVTVSVTVSSKGQMCARGRVVAVQLPDALKHVPS